MRDVDRDGDGVSGDEEPDDVGDDVPEAAEAEPDREPVFDRRDALSVCRESDRDFCEFVTEVDRLKDAVGARDGVNDAVAADVRESVRDAAWDAVPDCVGWLDADGDPMDPVGLGERLPCVGVCLLSVCDKVVARELVCVGTGLAVATGVGVGGMRDRDG